MKTWTSFLLLILLVPMLCHAEVFAIHFGDNGNDSYLSNQAVGACVQTDRRDAYVNTAAGPVVQSCWRKIEADARFRGPVIEICPIQADKISLGPCSWILTTEFVDRNSLPMPARFQ